MEVKAFDEEMQDFQKRKRSVPACRYARIVAEIAKGNVQAEQIANALGDGLKNVQNRLGELREAGILEVRPLARNCDVVGRSRIEWRIAA